MLHRRPRSTIVAVSRPSVRVRPAAVLTALLTVAALVGCGSGAAAPPATGPPIPDVVDQPLDVAKTALVTAGFTGESQDLLRDRDQLVDGNWVVCTQDPGPGPAPAGTAVALGVVKDAETCPGAAPATTAPTTGAAPTTTRAPASRVPEPRPVPVPRPTHEPEPTADDDDRGRDDDGDSGSDDSGSDDDSSDDDSSRENSGGGGSAGTVHPGSFCDPPGVGVSKTGKPMVCAPGSDGRNRWQGA